MLPSQIFPAQVGADIYLMPVFHIIATFGVMMTIFAVAMLEAGLVRSKTLHIVETNDGIQRANG